jgi:putative endonuclease
MKYFVYIVICSDKTLYTGYTNNIDKRIDIHNKGKGAKYTKTRRPVWLVYKEEFKTKSDAMKREYQIKQLSRKEKKQLLENKGIII